MNNLCDNLQNISLRPDTMPRRCSGGLEVEARVFEALSQKRMNVQIQASAVKMNQSAIFQLENFYIS